MLALRVGLNIFDLPGAGSDENLENFNRASLGLEQLEEYEKIDYLQLLRFSQDSSAVSKPKGFFDTSFQDSFPPDIILYIVAHNKGFEENDKLYLTSLLKKYKEKVIFALNLFPDTADSKYADDCQKLILNHCRLVCGNSFVPYIQEISCKSSAGLSNLFLRMKYLLGEENKRIFRYILDYPKDTVEQKFLSFVKGEFIKLCSYAPSQKPERLNPTGGEGYLFSTELKYLTISASNYLSAFSNINENIFLQSYLEVIDKKINLLSQKFTEAHFEDVYKSRSVPIYEKVPVYKEIYVDEVDYDSPIYEERTVYEEPDNIFEGAANWLNTSKWENKKTMKVKVGYESKSVKKKILKKYKKKISDYEYEDYKADVIKKGETFKHFGYAGIAIVLSAIYIRLVPVEGQDIVDVNILSDMFDQYYGKALESCRKLSIRENSSVSEIHDTLHNSIDYIFGDEVDASIKAMTASIFDHTYQPADRQSKGEA